jgi:hypothetical protein
MKGKEASARKWDYYVKSEMQIKPDIPGNRDPTKVVIKQEQVKNQ